MIYFEIITSVLVVSDVHLGDKFCKREDFSYFLSSILESRIYGKLPSLRALVILGDFFDFIWSTCENLCNNNIFVEIYELLQAIKNNCVDIIISLGNHEISIWVFYNIEFEKRKIAFLERLRNNKFYFSFLNELTICQYVILGQNSRNETVLALFDSIYDIEFNKYGQVISDDGYREIILKHKALLNDYCYFMVHGYQFEDWLFHHTILAPIWKSFVEDDNERVILNELWYEFKQENLDITTENIERIVSTMDIDISEFSSKKIEQDLSKIDKKLKHNGRNIKNEVYHDKIKQFMAFEKYMPITHIIFGHSHESDLSLIEDLTMLNTGCWVKGKKPSYIEIYLDGRSRVKDFLAFK